MTVDVIDNRAAYLEAVAAISPGTGPIAIDAERASGWRYSQRAYLIQIFRRGAGTFLFDPPAVGSFTELNDAYKAKFKFPFIMAVKGSNRHQILAAFETRIHNPVDTEFKCALAQINKIALFRLLTL